MSKLVDLANLGQAIWLDYISRSLIETGELQRLVEVGLRGLTSNPTIFEKAIAGSADYDALLRPLAVAGKSTPEIYEALAMDDIRRAADILRPVYEQTDGVDGYVSLEVSPRLANDSQGTLAEATRLFASVARPNLMIKIPATPAGIPAIQAAIGRGINVNVTLIFSLAHYQAAAQAYIAGLEQLAANGGDVSGVASVASFFVSRLDTLLDPLLAGKGAPELQGKIANANAKVAYALFKEIFSGERWIALEQRGARVQRPLWASTGTKNSAYSDLLYVEELIGPHTVNTLPPNTLQALLDHGRVASTLETGLAEARGQLARLESMGISLHQATEKLQRDGVSSFAQSFDSLLASIAARRIQLLRERLAFKAHLNAYQPAVEAAFTRMTQERLAPRLWTLDHSLWRADPTEIANRLGWLTIARSMKTNLASIDRLVETVRREGYTHALLMGMGGSSLAPEVFRKTFGVMDGYLDLAVLDSTDPGAVLHYAQTLDPAKTLYIVSTKSGGTVETFSFFRYFYNQVQAALGQDQAGQHFMAITDPGSGLADTARQYRFRQTFLNDPNIGGRYSALSYFGLVPAALMGVDVAALLDRASAMIDLCAGDYSPSDNPALQLGAILGELARAGRDKAIFILSPAICSFGDWVEQLVAESTGKNGKGILPVVGEHFGEATSYPSDHLFVSMRLERDHTYDVLVHSLEAAGHPVVQLQLGDLLDLGGQFFLWELATAVAGYQLDIQPFDQPDVEAAKILARQMVDEYKRTGKLPQNEPVLQSDGISLFGDISASSLEEAVKKFLAQAQPGGYLALQAYIQPSREADASLIELRSRLREYLHLAVTSGYGPRFLHSTGQLHKGDAGNGLFIQLTADSAVDAAIPDQAGLPETSMSFGILKLAQALGDGQALRNARRRVLRIHLGQDFLTNMMRLCRLFD